MIGTALEREQRSRRDMENEARTQIERLSQLNERLTEECQRVESELAEHAATHNQSQIALNENARLVALVRPHHHCPSLLAD